MTYLIYASDHATDQNNSRLVFSIDSAELWVRAEMTDLIILLTMTYKVALWCAYFFIIFPPAGICSPID